MESNTDTYTRPKFLRDLTLQTLVVWFIVMAHVQIYPSTETITSDQKQKHKNLTSRRCVGSSCLFLLCLLPIVTVFFPTNTNNYLHHFLCHGCEYYECPHDRYPVLMYSYCADFKAVLPYRPTSFYSKGDKLKILELGIGNTFIQNHKSSRHCQRGRGQPIELKILGSDFWPQSYLASCFVSFENL